MISAILLRVTRKRNADATGLAKRDACPIRQTWKISVAWCNSGLTEASDSSIGEETAMPEFQAHPPIDARRPFDPSSTEGRFACLAHLRKRSGVYIFRHTRTHKILYIGESHTLRLNERIEQHYHPRDRGGNFRINHCKTYCNLSRCGNVSGQDKKACGSQPETSYEELLSYLCFKQLLSLSEILVFSFEDSAAYMIPAVEYKLISRLKPMHTDLPEHEPADVECVNDTVCNIIQHLETPAGG